jgi:peptide-methionine (S)-S-oxide reductase
LEFTTIGGGCFWCTEAVFLEIEGVKKVIPGYSGGHVKNPSYEQVVTGSTGHAEVIQVSFDPEKITYREILEIFFTMHDPTSLNRQGADVGTQYRSVIYYHDEDQRKVAEGIIAEMEDNNVFNLPIVTQLKPLVEFFEAEDYHTNYYNRNQNQAYCKFVIEPKLRKIQKEFNDQIKS